MAAHPFTVSPALTAIGVAYPQGDRIANFVAPIVPVPTESYKYTKFGVGDAFGAPDDTVGRTTAPNQVRFGTTEVSSSVKDHALDAPVPNADIEAYNRAVAMKLVGPVGPLEQASAGVTDSVLNRREMRVASLVTNLANFATGNKATLSGTGQWSDFANSDPMQTILDAFDGMLVRPTHGALGRLVATKLCMHPKIRASVFGSANKGGIAPIEQVAALLGLKAIYIGDAFTNTAAMGQPAVFTRAWGKDAVFFHRNDQANTRGFQMSFAMTAQWGDWLAGTIEDPDIGRLGGVRVRAGAAWDEIITANDLGYLFKNAVA